MPENNAALTTAAAPAAPPASSRASVRRLWKKLRRWAKKRAFITSLVAPIVLAFLYFILMASPMYISQASFAIRTADNAAPSGTDLAAMFLKAPGSTGNDAYIINDYIQSLDIAQDIDRELGVIKHYSSRKYDIVSRLWQKPTQDEFLTFWQRVVVPHLNVDTGIIKLNVRAYDPQMAQKITRAVIARSEALVNAMNERAQGDAVKLAREEVTRAEGRIRAAQAAMREFRDRHDLLDPTITASGLLQLVTTLEAEASALRTQIAEAQSFMRHDAPALTSLNQRLSAVEKQLAAEKARVAGQQSPQGNLNAIVAEYQDLTIEAEFAQKQLVSAMASLEQARIQQAAQSRYVVAYQQPTLPDESLYPRPYLFTLYIFLGTFILLGIVSLIWASIREHAGF